MTSRRIAGGGAAAVAALALLVPLAGHLPAQSATVAAPAPAAPAPPNTPDPCVAPGNIGTKVTAKYNGVPPSSQDPRLVGPTQLIKSAQIGECGGPITLPLYEGRMKNGTPVWYVLTDTTDQGNALALGLNFSSKLAYADSPSVDDARRGRDRDRDAVRSATQAADGTLIFEGGKVDFKPVRRIEGDSSPPSVAEPGSIGDSCYSPLVKVTNAGGHIYNAPVVAFGSTPEQLAPFCEGTPDYTIVHDKVLSICPEELGNGATGGTVTVKSTLGFSFARPVVYASFDSNDPVGATLEESTLAPRLSQLGLSRDDSVFSAVERLFAFANGPTGVDNPQRQGLDSAIKGEGGPLNVFGGIPTLALDYSPMWDLQLGAWTQGAIDKGYRSRETEEFAILGLVEDGWITGPGGAPYGSSGVIINCPVFARPL